MSPMMGASGVPMIRMFPGCGSAWKKPSSKMLLMVIVSIARVIDSPSKPSAIAS